MRNYNSDLISKSAYKISGIENGTMLTHQFLLNLMECSSVDQTYRSRVSKLKLKLIKDHGLFLKSIPKQGYEIVRRGEEIKIVSGEFENGIKKMVRAHIKTHFIDLDKMHPEQRTETLMVTQKIGNTIGMFQNGGYV